jgi:hypothetical protein
MRKYCEDSIVESIDTIQPAGSLEKDLELEQEDMIAKIWLNLSYFVTGEVKKVKANLKSLKGFIFGVEDENTNRSENAS